MDRLKERKRKKELNYEKRRLKLKEEGESVGEDDTRERKGGPLERSYSRKATGGSNRKMMEELAKPNNKKK